MGLVSTERKFGAGGNASAHTATVNARKIEESDELKHAKVDKSLSKAIMQARMAKKMTQKDLATKINEKPQVVGEYESGKAIPNGQIIVKVSGVWMPTQCSLLLWAYTFWQKLELTHNTLFRIVPSLTTIQKMERVLGVKLPRPGKKPATKPSVAASATAGGVVRGGPPKRR
jgi:putative transcription factor